MKYLIFTTPEHIRLQSRLSYLQNTDIFEICFFPVILFFRFLGTRKLPTQIGHTPLHFSVPHSGYLFLMRTWIINCILFLQFFTLNAII